MLIRLTATCAACRDSLMKNYYFAIRCFMLDFWDHSLGECQVSNSIDTERAIYHAADTNISNPQGARVITDLPRCIWLLAGGRICWVHSVRGEELADPDPQVSGLGSSPVGVFSADSGQWQQHQLQAIGAARHMRVQGSTMSCVSEQPPRFMLQYSMHSSKLAAGLQ
jgi:hypothetical protein